MGLHNFGAGSPWDWQCKAYGTRECRSPMGCTDTNRWRSQICSYRTTPMEKLKRCRMGIGTNSTQGPCSTSWLSIISTRLLIGRTPVSRQSLAMDTIVQMPFYIILCGQTKHVVRVRTCSTSTTVTTGHQIVPMLSADVGTNLASVWAGMVGDLAMNTYPLRARLTVQKISWSSGNCSRGAAWRCASNTEEDAVSVGRISSTLQERWPAVVEHDISRDVERTSRANWMDLSVDGSNSDGLSPVGTPEGARLLSPSQDYRTSRGKTSSLCVNGRCQPVKTCSRAGHAAHWHLPWNWRRPLGRPVVTTRRP
jgi:hypothetical protein